MQFMLMCCFEEEKWLDLPQAERATVMRDYAAWVESVQREGRHRATGRLVPSASAKTVRSRNGTVVVTDGPYAETKEQLGGYHLVECRDLDEALALAKRIPTLRIGGTIEVRAQEPEPRA